MLRVWSFLAIWIFLAVYPSRGFYYKKQEEQQRILTKARADCEEKIQNASYPTDSIYCNMTFDNVLCWNYTVAGTAAIQRCPAYIHRFTDENYATRMCHPNGTWSPRPGYYNSTSGWTNYSQCKVYPEEAPWFVKEHMHRWRIIYNVGYSLSLASLVVAIAILGFFKRLRCPRNRIHLNLFISFTLRACMCLIRDNATVQGVAFQSDLAKAPDGTLFFKPGMSHWRCKLLYCVFYYSLLVNYTWVTIEGIYLYRILFCHVVNPKKYIHLSEILGWMFPLLFLVPWGFMRYFTENYFCWNTHSRKSMFILHSVMLGSIMINTFFFIRIAALIFEKLFNETRSQLCSLLRLAKSMLILIPLFGVQYLILIAMPDEYINDSTHVAKNYLEHMFNSFQGFLISVLFCFLNGEVQLEIRRAWSRYMDRKPSSLRSYTQTSVVSNITREPSSLYNDTTGSGLNGHVIMDTYMAREPHSSYDVGEKSERVPLEEPEIFLG